jgi:Ras-related protein Rab-32
MDLKILVVGDIAVGKTSVIRKYVQGIFDENYKATIGVDFFSKDNLQLWDISGQERFSCVTRVFYRNAAGAVVVIDWSRPGSLETAFRWIEEIQEKLDYVIPFVILMNKADLPGEITIEDIESRLIAERCVSRWFLVSAKRDEARIDLPHSCTVDHAFKTMRDLALEYAKLRVEEEHQEILRLKEEREREMEGGCC